MYQINIANSNGTQNVHKKLNHEELFLDWRSKRCKQYKKDINYLSDYVPAEPGILITLGQLRYFN